jgi:hypothetical protein
MQPAMGGGRGPLFLPAPNRNPVSLPPPGQTYGGAPPPPFQQQFAAPTVSNPDAIDLDLGDDDDDDGAMDAAAAAAGAIAAVRKGLNVGVAS